VDYITYNHGAIHYLCNANFGGWFIFCRQETLDLNFIELFFIEELFLTKFVEEKKTNYMFFSLCRFVSKVVMF
jgi:hypothetical protein